MNIIHWNCQCAFRKKNERILSHSPDIMVVAECEHPDKLKFGKLTPKPSGYLWFGDNPNKGLAVFSYSDYSLKVMDLYDPQYRYVIPIEVTSGGVSYIMFAVWAMGNPKEPDKSYIGQVWLAMNHYKDLLNEESVILIGDFNSNAIWDRKARVGNHTDVVNLLANEGIHSLYHRSSQTLHGEEKDHTFFMYRKREKPYHIDYCFLSEQLISPSTTLEIGTYDEWCGLSDHVPLMMQM